MTTALPIDSAFVQDFLVGLLNTPSPTGFAERAMDYCEQAFALFPFLQLRRTPKGTLVMEWAGQSSAAPRALTAHADTLGAMVKEIKESGRLKLTKIGGFAWNTVEGEGCTVFTASGKEIRGSLLINVSSSHVYGAETGDAKRDDDHMEVRLDELTFSNPETRALGIRVGDFVAFDPRVEVSAAGFIRSRHLDDKACIASLLGAVKALHAAGLQPAQRTILHISNYEEVGHGAAAGFAPDVVELLAVDMAAMGRGQTSDEFNVTICVKDGGGPYHIDMTRKLTRLADAAGIPYKTDIYPYYGSDGEAYWRAGGDVRVGLIGMGVDASHNYERTHIDGVVRVAQLIAEYLRQD